MKIIGSPRSENPGSNTDEFFRQNCEVSHGASISAADLYQAYVTWTASGRSEEQPCGR